MTECDYIKDGFCTNTSITSKGHRVTDSDSSRFFCHACLTHTRKVITLIVSPEDIKKWAKIHPEPEYALLDNGNLEAE